MARPETVPDRVVWKGDPYELRLVFTNADGTARDLSGAAWVPSLAADGIVWTVNADEAPLGVVRLLLTADQTELLDAPYVRWDLFEENIWGRTIMTGRLVPKADV